MTQHADHVVSDPAAIARLEALIAALPSGARVELQLAHGGRLRAIVAARPILQVFRDAAGDEGSNAVVRLEDPAMDAPEAARIYDVWLDRIEAVTALPPGQLRGDAGMTSPRAQHPG